MDNLWTPVAHLSSLTTAAAYVQAPNGTASSVQEVVVVQPAPVTCGVSVIASRRVTTSPSTAAPSDVDSVARRPLRALRAG
jgi:hypothetical protein